MVLNSKRISRPVNPYDPAWAVWNAQNPHLPKSVGAAASGEGDGGDEAAAAAAAEAAKAAETAAAAAATKKASDDAAAEAARKAAEDKDKGGVSDEVAKLLKDVMKHKDRAKSAEGKVGEVESKLNTLMSKISKVLGVEKAEEVEAALEKVAQDEEAKLKASGEFDKLRERIVGEHTKELTKVKSDAEATTKELAKKVDSAEAEIRRLLVTNSFAASKFLADELSLSPHHAERLFGDSFKVEEKDGRRVVVAYGPNGQPLADSKGAPFAFDDALKELVNADPGKDSLFKPRARPGSGSGAAGREGAPAATANLRGAALIAHALANQKK